MDLGTESRLDLIEQLAKAANVTAARCHDRETAATHFRVRYTVYAREGFTMQELCPDGMESDPHDARAIHFLAWHCDQPVATLRMIPPPPVRRLSADPSLTSVPAFFSLYDVVNVPPLDHQADETRTAELGRLCVLPSHRLMSEVAILALARAAYIEAAKMQIDHWICYVRRPLVTLLRRMNITFETLTPLEPTPWNLQIRNHFPHYFSTDVQLLLIPLKTALDSVHIGSRQSRYL